MPIARARFVVRSKKAGQLVLTPTPAAEGWHDTSSFWVEGTEGRIEIGVGNGDLLDRFRKGQEILVDFNDAADPPYQDRLKPVTVPREGPPMGPNEARTRFYHHLYDTIVLLGGGTDIAAMAMKPHMIDEGDLDKLVLFNIRLMDRMKDRLAAINSMKIKPGDGPDAKCR